MCIVARRRARAVEPEVDAAALARRLRWLCRAPLVRVCDPEPAGALARAAALRGIAVRVAARGGDVVDQVAAVEAELAPADLERVEARLTTFAPNHDPRRSR